MDTGVAAVAGRCARIRRSPWRPARAPRYPKSGPRADTWRYLGYPDAAKVGDRRPEELYRIDLVVVIPWYRSFEAHIPLLRRFAAANDVPVVDLPDALRDIGESRDAYFVDKVHPNAQGHRLIARAILEELRRVW